MILLDPSNRDQTSNQIDTMGNDFSVNPGTCSYDDKCTHGFGVAKINSDGGYNRCPKDDFDQIERKTKFNAALDRATNADPNLFGPVKGGDQIMGGGVIDEKALEIEANCPCPVGKKNTSK